MKKYIAIVLISGLIGCELVVDVDIPLEKNSLVLSSFFSPDSVWKAKVGLNRHILDDAPYPFVENALVVVYEGENAIDTLTYDSLGYYRSDSGGPEPGKMYSMRAITSDFGTASSSSRCPENISATFSPIESAPGEFGQKEYSFSITFTDQPGKNFYQVMGIGEFRHTDPRTGKGYINRSHVWVRSDDDGIDPEKIQNIEGFFFPDVLFDGETFTVNVKMNPNNWIGNGSTKYYLYFRSVSEDYYRHKTTELLQNYTAGDPFAQPVKVFSNIENGLGIFAGFTQTVIVLEE